MGEGKVEKLLAGMDPAGKKKLLDDLVFALVTDLNETERKEMLQTMLSGQKDNQRLASMVEY